MRDFGRTTTENGVVNVGKPEVVDIQVAILVEVGIQDITVIRGTQHYIRQLTSSLPRKHSSDAMAVFYVWLKP